MIFGSVLAIGDDRTMGLHDMSVFFSVEFRNGSNFAKFLIWY